MEFTADRVEYWSQDGIETVFLGNEAKGLALTLSSSVPEVTDHYLEWNSQANACANAVKSIRLAGSKLQIELLAKAAKQIGEAQFVIELACDADVLREVAERLRMIFGDRFTLTKQAAAAPESAPKQDYSTVKYLNLEGKNLKALPAHVKDLHALETVKLAHNPQLDFADVCDVLSKLTGVKELSFTMDGPVPESLGELRSLETLSLDGFTQPVVFPESVGQLTKLRRLQIMSDADVILPESVAELRELESLNVRAPSWQAPSRIEKLAKLTHLDLDHCRFARVPEGLAGMDAVTTVFLGGQGAAELAQLLPLVARMRNLTTLQLAAEVVPEEIALCQQIEELVIWGAKEIPAAIGKLKGLKTLVLTLGHFETLPEAIGELTGLTMLNVSENESLQELPESLGNLTQLQSLFLDENPRLTRLPRSVGRLMALEDVRLTEKVSGVPESWSKLLN